MLTKIRSRYYDKTDTSESMVKRCGRQSIIHSGQTKEKRKTIGASV